MTVALTNQTRTDWDPEIWDLPERPPDDVSAVREQCGSHHIWERSRVDPTRWYNASTGATRSWRVLVAEHAPLRRHEFENQVWVVRPDGQILPIYIYSSESAAIAAAGHTHRVQPWTVLIRPVDNSVD